MSKPKQELYDRHGATIKKRLLTIYIVVLIGSLICLSFFFIPIIRYNSGLDLWCKKYQFCISSETEILKIFSKQEKEFKKSLEELPSGWEDLGDLLEQDMFSSYNVEFWSKVENQIWKEDTEEKITRISLGGAQKTELIECYKRSCKVDSIFNYEKEEDSVMSFIVVWKWLLLILMGILLAFSIFGLCTIKKQAKSIVSNVYSPIFGKWERFEYIQFASTIGFGAIGCFILLIFGYSFDFFGEIIRAIPYLLIIIVVIVIGFLLERANNKLNKVINTLVFDCLKYGILQRKLYEKKGNIEEERYKIFVEAKTIETGLFIGKNLFAYTSIDEIIDNMNMNKQNIIKENVGKEEMEMLVEECIFLEIPIKTEEMK